MMVAIAAVRSYLNAGRLTRWLIAGSLIASGYGFAVALPVAAFVGKRGLAASGPLSNRLVFAGNSLGAWASFLGAIVVLYACLSSL
jgi:hypothetical protein